MAAPAPAPTPPANEYDIEELPLAEETALEPEPAKPASPKKIEHSANDLAEAFDYGFPTEQVSKLSPEELKIELRATRKWLVAERQRALAEDTRTEGRRPAPKEPDPAAVKPLAEQDLTEEEGFDPRIVALQKELRSLKQKQGDVEQKVNRREQASRDEMLDDAFAALGPGYEKLFGTGGAADLVEAKQNRELGRRATVYREAKILETDTPKQIAKKIKFTAEFLFDAAQPAAAAPDKPGSIYDRIGTQTQVPDTVAGTQRDLPPRGPDGKFTTEQWNQAGLARPSNRNEAATPPGRKKAMENLAENLRNVGSFEASGEAELDDFL